MVSFFILEYLPRQSLDQIVWKMTFGKTLVWSSSISMVKHFLLNYSKRFKGYGQFYLYQNLDFGSLDRRQMAFDNHLG